MMADLNSGHMMMDAHMAHGVASWRHGGVDGKPDKVNALMYVPRMGWRKMAVVIFLGVCNGACRGSSRSVCDPGSLLGCLVKPLVFYDYVCRREFRTHGPDMTTSLIKFIGVVSIVASEVVSD
jgi:hypothetical protein